MASDQVNELNELSKASAGLEYPSESDAPFEPFRWDAAGGSAQQQVAAHALKRRKICEIPVDGFFGALEGSEDAERFQQLRGVLEKRLKGLKVFRVGEGEVKVDIYLIGQTPSGAWAGLHTTSVET